MSAWLCACVCECVYVRVCELVSMYVSVKLHVCVYVCVCRGIKSPDMQYVVHKIIKNTCPSYRVTDNDTEAVLNCSRAGKQAVSYHSVWLVASAVG
jgi:hypothetical protein